MVKKAPKQLKAEVKSTKKSVRAKSEDARVDAEPQQAIQPTRPKAKIAGRRAGRPVGSGKYGEPTKAVRVPVSFVDRVDSLVERGGLVCKLYDYRIQAGFPSPADDAPSTSLDLASFLVPNPPATFFIRVSGESMRDAGIFPDDILIVDRSLEATNGDVVVAAVDGEFTVKRLYKSRGVVELRPENKRFSPIRLEGDAELVIWGVVKKVIHNV